MIETIGLIAAIVSLLAAILNFMYSIQLDNKINKINNSSNSENKQTVYNNIQTGVKIDG